MAQSPFGKLGNKKKHKVHLLLRRGGLAAYPVAKVAPIGAVHPDEGALKRRISTNKHLKESKTRKLN